MGKQSFKIPQRIIIRMPNWVGDLVMATPLLKDLRQAFPKAHITAMCQKPICALLKENSNIDELFCFDKVRHFGRRCERKDLIQKLQWGNYDCGIIVPQSFSSAWWFFRAGIPRRIGFSVKSRDWFLTDKIALPQQANHQHLLTTYKHLLTSLDIPLSSSSPHLFLREQEILEAQTLLQQFNILPHHYIICIHPGAAYGSAKCWPPERFRALTQKLLTHAHFRILYVGDASCHSIIGKICQEFPKAVINLAGSIHLRQLAAITSLCHLFITNDSGPMHIAAAFKKPLIALFGSTNDIVTGPYQTGKVIHKHVACSPCYQRECPLDFRCMNCIDPEEVYQEALNLLDQQQLILTP